jgi:hypothetical protein
MSSIIIGILAIVGLGVAFCWLNDRFMNAIFRWRNPPEKLAAEKAEVERRLLNPDWQFYERHLGRPAPAALRTAFADHALLLSEDLEFQETHSIQFWPIDEKCREESRKWLGLDVVPFANSNDDLIYLKPGPNESDAVFITYHDGGDTEILVPSVNAFLANLHHWDDTSR